MATMPTDMDHPRQELALADEHSRPERPQNNKKQTRLILLGSAILQLPIWGFAMTFGIFQESYSHSPHLHNTATGIIGTTTNGVLYLLMPLLFTALDRGPWSRYRRLVASTGICLSTIAFLLSSWSTQLWHLILTQGILAALGNTLVYSPTTLYLDEYFSPASNGRGMAYGAILASKNIVGTCCPILFSTLLTHLGFGWTLRIWALVVLLTATLGLALLPTRHHHHQRPSSSTSRSPSQKIPWSFLSHRTIYIHLLSNILFATGYGVPQTYLPLYATSTSTSSFFSHYSPLTSSLLLTLFNAPGILSCLAFAHLSSSLPSSLNTFISAFGSATTAIFLWGLAPSQTHPSFLISFSILFGFFAGGYSSTWGGWIDELEAEAEVNGEAIHSGMVYGLFNGARGVGYLVSGFVGVELLKGDGGGGLVEGSMERGGFGTRFGGVILCTGVSCAVGGWGVVWTGWKWVRGRL